MNDLSHEARSLLAVARNAALPAGPRRQNIKHAVLLRVAAVTAASAGASVASATSLAGKVVLGGLLATMATGGAIGAWKWRASGETAHAPRTEGAEAVSPARPGPVPTLTKQTKPQVGTPAIGLGLPQAPVLKLATRAPDRSVGPSPSPTSTGARKTREQVAAEPVRPQHVLPTVPSVFVPPTPTQGTGQAQVAEPWRASETPPVSHSVLALPILAQPPRPGEIAELGRRPAGFRDRQPMLARPSPAQETLQREVAELRRAQEALRSGHPALALRLLTEYDRAFPNGSLREEHAAIAAIATCQVEPSPRAQARAQAFLRESPRALLSDRVRAACLP